MSEKPESERGANDAASARPALPPRFYIRPRPGFEDDDAEWDAIVDRIADFIEVAKQAAERDRPAGDEADRRDRG